MSKNPISKFTAEEQERLKRLLSSPLIQKYFKALFEDVTVDQRVELETHVSELISSDTNKIVKKVQSLKYFQAQVSLASEMYDILKAFKNR